MERAARPIALVVVLLGASIAACSGPESHGTEEEQGDAIATQIVESDDDAPISPDAALRRASTLAVGTLIEVRENVATTEGPNEDEREAPYVEWEGLVFSVDEVLVGEAPQEVIIGWQAWYRDPTPEGEPGPRVAEVVFEGANFSASDVGERFLLSLSPSGLSIDPSGLGLTSWSNGLTRIPLQGSLRSVTSAGSAFGGLTMMAEARAAALIEREARAGS